MSTKTTFKRIALVAVAALGLGVLSVAPSQAIVSGALTITTAAGSTSVTAGSNDTTTAATISVSGLLLDGTNDSVTVSVVQKSAPTASSAVKFKLHFVETTTSAVSEVKNNATGAGDRVTVTHGSKNTAGTLAYDSTTAFTTGQSEYYSLTSNGAGYAGMTIGLMADTSTAAARVAGAYVFSAVVQTYSGGLLTNTQTSDVTFTINDTAVNVAAVNGTIDPSKTTAYINAGDLSATSAVDSAVAVVATAAATNHATIQVKTYTATSLAAPESVTVTLTGAGQVCNAGGTVCGNNITIAGDGDDLFRVRANGTAGTASIVVATTTKTFPAKTVTFYAKSPATITVSTNKPVIAVAAASAQTDVIRAVAKDANGNVWGGQLYSFAATAADALIASSATTPVACSFNSTYGYHECSVTGTAKGTANIKVMDASLDTDATIATTDAAVTSSAATTRVSTGSATTAKLAFDKATYAPGEKAQIWVQVLDAEGLALPATTVTNAFTADLVSSVAFSTGSSVSGSASPAMAAATDATVPTVAGYAVYTVYMPYASGDVKITATGSTGLAAAGRVEVSATASVVNSSVDAATDAANEATDAANAATDAALAAADAADAATAAAQDASDAVAALSATVAKLVASLKAQITSLTNLVIKIQKKVRA